MRDLRITAARMRCSQHESERVTVSRSVMVIPNTCTTAQRMHVSFSYRVATESAGGTEDSAAKLSVQR